MEDENTRLAADMERKRLLNAKGRRSTNLIGVDGQSAATQNLLGFQSPTGASQ